MSADKKTMTVKNGMSIEVVELLRKLQYGGFGATGVKLIDAVRKEADERWEKAIGEAKQKGHFCVGCGGFFLGETPPSDCDCFCKPGWIEGFAMTTAAIRAAKGAK